ncbi:MAG: hypothetical protein J6R50_02660 [Alistipes sp.]|nr:hypothetical protein [Alistipes sp.]
MKIRQFAVAIMAAVVALAGWSCDKEPTETPVEKPTIGIMEPEFNAETMELSVMIAPSTDTEAWYWMVKGGIDTDDAMMTKEEGAAAKEIKFTVKYGVEYTITAYAENKAGKSDIAEKKFCAMPEGEVALTIGEITINEDTSMAEATIYPSKATEVWYWQSYATDEDNSTLDWNVVEGNTEMVISFPYTWGKTMELRAYAECGNITSDIVTAECFFELAVPTITVSKPHFDEATMTVSFDVTPSEETDHWCYGIKGGQQTTIEGNEAKSVEFKVEYDKEYEFIFRAENAINEGEEKVVDFCVISPVAEVTIENLTAYTLDAVVTKKEHCVRYVAGIVHTSAYDRNTFVEQAQASLNPDPSYPFAVFNSATESRTFSEQDLVRNSRTDSNENAGIILLPNTSYTIAIYGENQKGNYTVTTKEVVVPEAVINGDTAISVEVSEVGLTSAKATITAEAGCKVLSGYIDPALAKADTENPFDFEGKSDQEIKAYIASAVKGVPTIYTEPFTYTLSDLFAIDTEYIAYAVAIKDGKIGEVTFEPFKTLRPSLTGVAEITAAEIVPQTSHETLTVKLTVDSNAQKVRLYAAPASDHSAYADNLEYVMDADEYQNYREEYNIENGVATCVVDIYHPAANYYMYASAVDANGRAGKMVCVTKLAGLDTEYYTTMEEVIEEGSLSYKGTGDATLLVEVQDVVDDRISAVLTATQFSDNVDKVWFIRYNGKISEVESQVKEALVEYVEKNKIIGSYKIAKEDIGVKYIDGGSSWDPKYEALQSYDDQWGGDIVVMVILDTDGKVKIHSYYAAGRDVTKL